MTTFENISDELFNITFTTSEFNTTTPSLSGKVKHSGIVWWLGIRRNDSNALGCYLIWKGNNSNIWSANVVVTFKISKKNNRNSTRSMQYSRVIDWNGHNWGFDDFMEGSELTDEYIDDGKITIECAVEIKSLTGITRKKKRQFTEKDEDLSDVVLVVEDKKLHVNKAILANASPVFRAMFYSGFKESTADEIPIKDVKYDDFNDMLQIIYDGHLNINNENAEGLLILADRFDVQDVAQKCEMFLINIQMKTEEKLKLADRYKLSILHGYCLDSIKNMADLRRIGADVLTMGEATAKALLIKAMSFTSIE